MATKRSQGPFIAKIILFTVFILDELIVLLVDRVVGKMHVLVVLVDLRRVCLTCKSCKTFLEDIDSEWFVGGDENVNS